ncbi:hypothetical protein WR25_27159 [Diploscapter pachys]|uniref:PPM-type phosphatase domain-containing protein n=1 Tax=Diploscapter pachys TaxID=2018661 RepID=A0A2A2LWD4_9BILA|nr:hypothetical protein WR25_27159 [Diploscapter pachys]
MPSSFIRRHVRGLLRGKLSPSTSLEATAEAGEDDPPTPTREANEFLSQCYLAGIDGRKLDFPEVYFGKTGLDIPCIHLQPFSNDVFASYTGPDGGLTQVGEIRRQPLVRMANLDDEMSLSVGESSEDEGIDKDSDEDTEQPALSQPLKKNKRQRSNNILGSCSSLIGPNGGDMPNGNGADKFDWSCHDSERAFGLSVSLYEKNPNTGVNAGEPIADVWGVIGRNNNGVLAMADGVNWGEGARTAARCAVRGAIDHMNVQIEDNSLCTTTEVFHELLAAFHSAHSLILQEGGLLTTLCVAVVVPAKHGNSWVLCCCNVGDSLCFVYNRNYGVREVTLGSHDIDQMRDMRDAGGALGPVDGRNPQLHNLTCSMTFVEAGDTVFLTSDGVSDNFDPVVGKFCVIRRTESENNKENNSQLPPREARTLNISTKDSPQREYARTRPCAATLPCVDAATRHELMLVRMRDIIANGIEPNRNTSSMTSSPRHEPLFPRISASLLCHRLIQFATQLSQAKRRTLENPELYKKEKMSKSEQRARRKAVREKIADMPGKLDHASVVAYAVGIYEENDEEPETPRNIDDAQHPSDANANGHRVFLQQAQPSSVIIQRSFHFENYNRIQNDSCTSSFLLSNGDRMRASLEVASSEFWKPAGLTEKLELHKLVDDEESDSPYAQRPISPYEQVPVLSLREETTAKKPKKKHGRGTVGRHTLGVDVQWLKKLVTRRDSRGDIVETDGDSRMQEQSQIHQLNSLSSTATGSESRTSTNSGVSLKQRLRGLIGSNRNLNAGMTTVRQPEQRTLASGRERAATERVIRNF